MTVLLFYFPVLEHDCCITLLYYREVFVFHIHPMPHVAVGRRLSEAVQNALHVTVVRVESLVYTQHLFVVVVPVFLVEHAQHHVQAVVYLAMKTRYLHDNALVGQALHKGVWQPMRHHIVVIVACLMVDIQHRLLNVAHLVA